MQRAKDILSVAPGRQSGYLASLLNQDTADAVELAFLARQLVQVTLPHRNPGDVSVWTRRNGDITLVMARTGINERGQLIGYPYGSIPRLLLYWLNSEAVRTKNRYLELGDNLSRFMRELGLNPRNGTGERGDARRLKDQMDRLFCASIRLQKSLSGTNGAVGRQSASMPIVSKSELWWQPRDPNQSLLWNSWIELSQEFYDMIVAAPVPLNLKALKALKRSPLALDLYAWLSYKSWNATRLNAAQTVPWDLLHGQLGADYSELKNFKHKALGALRKIIELQPEFRIASLDDGVQVRPTPIKTIEARAKRL